jgi:hypothetical protein
MEQKAEVLTFDELRKPFERGDADRAGAGHSDSADPRDTDARVRLVALVDVHDHGREAFQ